MSTVTIMIAYVATALGGFILLVRLTAEIPVLRPVLLGTYAIPWSVQALVLVIGTWRALERVALRDPSCPSTSAGATGHKSRPSLPS